MGLSSRTTESDGAPAGRESRESRENGRTFPAPAPGPQRSRHSAQVCGLERQNPFDVPVEIVPQ